MTFAGPTIALIPLSPDHLDDFCRYSVDASLWTWWLRKPPVDRETMRAQIEQALAQAKTGQRIPFSIFHHGRGECIGSTSFWFLDPINLSVEIGSTWLGMPHHGGPINQECKRLLLAHAFNELCLNRVMFQTDELNARSRRALEKLGAKLDGIMREDKITWNGRVRSSAVYSILRSEWAG